MINFQIRLADFRFEYEYQFIVNLSAIRGSLLHTLAMHKSKNRYFAYWYDNPKLCLHNYSLESGWECFISLFFIFVDHFLFLLSVILYSLYLNLSILFFSILYFLVYIYSLYVFNSLFMHLFCKVTILYSVNPTRPSFIA